MQLHHEQSRQMQNLRMHKYVLMLVGILVLLAATFLLAYLRIGQSKKFTGIPVKSLTLESQWEVNSVN
jgi:hypothetical protein